MRYAKRTDRNHAEVRSGLRALGYLVLDFSAVGGGVPDLCVWCPRRGSSVFLEVKDGKLPPSDRQLTDAEQQWMKFNAAITRVVLSLEDAIAAVREFEHG